MQQAVEGANTQMDRNYFCSKGVVDSLLFTLSVLRLRERGLGVGEEREGGREGWVRGKEGGKEGGRKSGKEGGKGCGKERRRKGTWGGKEEGGRECGEEGRRRKEREKDRQSENGTHFQPC